MFLFFAPPKKNLCKKMSTSHWFPSRISRTRRMDASICWMMSWRSFRASLHWEPINPSMALQRYLEILGWREDVFLGLGIWKIQKQSQNTTGLGWRLGVFNFLFTCDTRLPLSGKIRQCHWFPVSCSMFFEFQQPSAKRTFFNLGQLDTTWALWGTLCCSLNSAGWLPRGIIWRSKKGFHVACSRPTLQMEMKQKDVYRCR